jgi:hypothetical protein
MGQEHIEWVFDDAKDTIIERGTERDQADGERTIPRCVTAFNAVTGHELSDTDGWLFMQILKMCRSVQGAYKYDDYRDGVGYAALRAEEARVENEAKVAPSPPGHVIIVNPGGLARDCTAGKGTQVQLDIADQMGWADCECDNCTHKNAELVPPECDARNV